VQVDLIKPTLKRPGTRRLRLKSDELLSSSALNFNLRRYMEEVVPLLELTAVDAGEGAAAAAAVDVSAVAARLGVYATAMEAALGGAAAGRGLHSFPFPLNLSSLCPFPLNFGLLCTPQNPK